MLVIFALNGDEAISSPDDSSRQDMPASDPQIHSNSHITPTLWLSFVENLNIGCCRLRFGTLRLMAIESHTMLLVMRPWLDSDDSSESGLKWFGVASNPKIQRTFYNQIMCLSYVTNRNAGSSRFRFGTLPLRAIERHRSLVALAVSSVRYVFLPETTVCIVMYDSYIIFQA